MKKLLAIFTTLMFVLAGNSYAVKTTINIDEHKGLNRKVEDKIVDGGHARFDNVFIKDGNIRSIKGRDKLNSTANADPTVNGFFYYEKPEILGDCDTCDLLLSFDSEPLIDDVGTHTATIIGDDGTTAAIAAKFGPSGIQLPGGATDDYVSIPDNDDWFFDTNDFTIDFWYVRTSGVFPQTFVSQYQDANNWWRWWGSDGTHHKFQVVSGGSTVIDIEWSDGGVGVTQLHYALVRSGTTFTLYRSGVVQTVTGGSATDSDAIPNLSAALLIGQDAGTNENIIGRMDEFRLDNGTAHFTTAFNTELPDEAYVISSSALQKLVVAESDDIVTYDLDGSNRTVIQTDVDNSAWDFVQVANTIYMTNTVSGQYKWDGVQSTANRVDAAPKFPYLEEYKGVLFAAEDRVLRFSNDVGSDLSDDETWDANNELLVGTDQHLVTGLHKTSNSLIIFTEGSIHELTGFGAASFRLRNISIGVGAINGNTIEEDPNGDLIFFSGIAGVYKLRVGQDLSDDLNGTLIDRPTGTLQKLSSPLDDVFEIEDSEIVLSSSDYLTAHAYYDIRSNFYLLYIGNNCFVYDNVNQEWSRIPATKMAASLYAYSVNQNSGQAFLLDDLGFFYENFKGYENGVESGTVTGTTISSTSTTLTDTIALFDTTNDGLKGVWVYVDNENREYRRIISNTGTTLTVENAWTTNPSETDQYYIGYIIPDFKTKQYSFVKAPKETDMNGIWWVHNKSDSAQDLEILFYENKSDTPSTVTYDTTIDLSQNLFDKLNVRTRGSWIQWEMRSFIYNTSDTINPPIDISAYVVDVKDIDER